MIFRKAYKQAVCQKNLVTTFLALINRTSTSVPQRYRVRNPSDLPTFPVFRTRHEYFIRFDDVCRSKGRQGQASRLPALSPRCPLAGSFYLEPCASIHQTPPWPRMDLPCCHLAAVLVLVRFHEAPCALLL